MARVSASAVLRHLFDPREPEGTELYAVLDSARHPRLWDSIGSSGLHFECLFAGRINHALSRAAPYLVTLRPDAAFMQTLVEEGWGSSWGVYLAATCGFSTLRRHLRKFLRVREPGGRILYFRYYDPRVLRDFLPTCDKKQVAEIFGPVSRFDMEAVDPRTLARFRARRIEGRGEADLLTSTLDCS